MISIILVTYNRAERLILSIQDILNQTFKNFELIICDDCSTDATEEICLEFVKKDARIKYYRHSSNMQMPANCNFGIKKAEFEYIAILHDGDRFSPDLIQKWSLYVQHAPETSNKVFQASAIKIFWGVNVI